MITFDFGNFERSLSRSLQFRRLISRKGAELNHVLPLDTNTKLDSRLLCNEMGHPGLGQASYRWPSEQG